MRRKKAVANNQYLLFRVNSLYFSIPYYKKDPFEILINHTHKSSNFWLTKI